MLAVVAGWVLLVDSVLVDVGDAEFDAGAGAGADVDVVAAVCGWNEAVDAKMGVEKKSATEVVRRPSVEEIKMKKTKWVAAAAAAVLTSQKRNGEFH